LGHARCLCPQENLQQALGHRQTDPFGLCRGGEAGLLVLVDHHRPGQLLLHVPELLSQLADGVFELLQPSSNRLTADRRQDQGGFAVESLPRHATLPGMPGDSAMSASEYDTSTGQNGRQTYLGHGVNSNNAVFLCYRYCSCSPPICPLFHLLNRRS
jgi:hypothetical protein